MKKQKLSLLVLFVILILSSCNSGKKTSDEIVKDDTSAVVKGESSEVVQEEEQKIEIDVMGTVKEINKGKDGYTAKIVDETGKIFNATISIPNLKDPKQYRSVAVGEKINVKGESFASDPNNYIVVRELLK